MNNCAGYMGEIPGSSIPVMLESSVTMANGYRCIEEDEMHRSKLFSMHHIEYSGH